jgi:predicted nucleotide-binding protein (sugar kinase/HSP70/actin superfamily)
MLQQCFRAAYQRLRNALGGLPYPLPDQYELRRLATPFFHHRLSGGEGDMLIGKVLYARQHRTAHMICELTPYSCLPNTMSIGAMANVLGKYPDLLYAPIEIKGDAEAHAFSRCQMILTEAKKRAREEFDAAADRAGVSLPALRRALEQRPEWQRAGRPVPNRGAAGTAANLVLALAGARAN